MSYLGWFDDNPKKSAAQKIVEALAAYEARYGVPAGRVLVNEQDRAVVVEGVEIVVASYMRVNNFGVQS
jgi:tRNA(Arg) A34 adenosine deaminase TadA